MKIKMWDTEYPTFFKNDGKKGHTGFLRIDFSTPYFFYSSNGLSFFPFFSTLISSILIDSFSSSDSSLD